MIEDKRTEEEKEFVNLIEKLPKDTQEYIKNLLHELSLSYEYMAHKEGFNMGTTLIRNHFENKEKSYTHLWYLLNESWRYKKEDSEQNVQ